MVEGHLIIDPTTLDGKQTAAIRTLAEERGGWVHPDGVRWIIPVTGPSTQREKLIGTGFPETAVRVAT